MISAVTLSCCFSVINVDMDTNNELLSLEDLSLRTAGLCIFISASYEFSYSTAAVRPFLCKSLAYWHAPCCSLVY